MSKTTTTASTSSDGTSTSSLLGVAFVILKLTHVINWSWWWVLAPFWIPAAIVGFVCLAVGLVGLGAWLLDHRSAKKRAKKRKEQLLANVAARRHPRTPRYVPKTKPPNDGPRLHG